MSNRSRSNAIISNFVNGSQVKGVRVAGLNHFSTHFQVCTMFDQEWKI
jgi:hypothetical protein